MRKNARENRRLTSRRLLGPVIDQLAATGGDALLS